MYAQSYSVLHLLSNDHVGFEAIWGYSSKIDVRLGVHPSLGPSGRPAAFQFALSRDRYFRFCVALTTLSYTPITVLSDPH